MTVYLVDAQFVDIALSFASGDGGARIVLLEDAVYAAPRLGALKELYVLEDDVARRGVRNKMPNNAHVIGYDGLVELMEREKVVNFV